MADRREFDILGIGTVFVDHLIHVEHYPQADSKAAVTGEGRSFGGLIGSALAAAASMGARCAYMGVLGEDELSTALCRALRDLGVECLIRTRPGARPGHSTIIVDDSAHTRTILHSSAGAVPLEAEAVRPETVAAARVVLVDSWAIDAAARAAGFAREIGVPVVADMEHPAGPAGERLAGLADHLILGCDPASPGGGRADPGGMVEQLHRRRPRACTAVTVGEAGCYYLAGPEATAARHQPAFDIQPVETTGCGDVFHGAYAAALAGGAEAPACIRTAAAAAAVYASRPSGWQYLPTREEVQALLTARRT